MPNIKKMSDLRNYTDVLEEVGVGSPVFLTRNGEGRYAIVDMAEYDSMKAALWGRLYEELDESRRAENTLSLAQVRARFRRGG